jgi:hypothetical protein
MRCRFSSLLVAWFLAAFFTTDFGRGWCLRFPFHFRVCVSVTFYAELNVWFSVLLAMRFCIEHVVIRFCGMPFHSLGIRLHFRSWLDWRRDWMLEFPTLHRILGLPVFVIFLSSCFDLVSWVQYFWHSDMGFGFGLIRHFSFSWEWYSLFHSYFLSAFPSLSAVS